MKSGYWIDWLLVVVLLHQEILCGRSVQCGGEAHALLIVMNSAALSQTLQRVYIGWCQPCWGAAQLPVEPVGKTGDRRQCHERAKIGKFASQILIRLLDEEVAERHAAQSGLTV